MAKQKTTSPSAALLSEAHRREVKKAQERELEFQKNQEAFQKERARLTAESVRRLCEQAPTISPIERLSLIRRVERQTQHEQDKRLLEQIEAEKAGDK